MKRFLALLLILSMLPLTACGKTETPPAAETPGVSEPQPLPEEPPVTPEPETVSYTRVELEDALSQVAFAYFLKGTKIQYDSAELNYDAQAKTNVLRKFFYGAWRTNLYSKLEDAASDKTVFTVCSDYCWNVYNEALGYPIFGMRLNGITNGFDEFSESPEDMCILRWARSGELTETEKKYGVTEKHMVSAEQSVEFVKNYKENLRPGDIIDLLKGGDGNHAMLYIGGGFVLDSWGRKYNMTDGTDSYEPNGSVFTLHHVTNLYIAGTDSFSGSGYRLGESGPLSGVTILRPLNILCTDDGDGDPANDLLNTEYEFAKSTLLSYPENMKTSGYTITGDTLGRMRYHGIEIDRTAAASVYGTLASGAEQTYSIKITNGSSNNAYKQFMSAVRNENYTGETYKDLTVTETVPEGTTLVNAPDAEVDGNTIRWTIDLAPGEVRTLTYTVSVSAKRGETVVNGGGTVGGIASNTITNRVGGAKLSEKAQKALSDFAAAKIADWSSPAYQIGKNDVGAAFADKLYKSVLGIDLALPALQSMTDNLFTLGVVRGNNGFYTHKNETVLSVLYKQNENVKPEYALLRQMMVRGFVGGGYLWTDVYNDEPRINEFFAKYLEPGDILCQIDLSEYMPDLTPRTVEDASRVLVYLGDERFAGMTQGGELVRAENMDEVWRSFAYDLFFLLRPTQAYDSIEKDAVFTGSLAFDPADAIEAAEQKAALSPAQIETLQSLSASGVNGSNASFISGVYDQLGIDVRTNGFKDKTISQIFKDFLFTFRDERCVLPDKPAYDGYGNLRKMMLRDYYGGRAMDRGSVPALSDLLIGDAVILGICEGPEKNMDWTTMVYLGDGRFLFNSNYRTVSGGDITTVKEQRTYDEAAFKALLENEKWTGFVAFRPLQMFE